MELDAKPKKAMHLINLIRQCQELALTMRAAGEFLRRRAEITWKHGQGELSERSERKGDVLYQLAHYF